MNRNTLTDIEPTKAIVYVANKKLDFITLRLEQAYGEHHSFCIRADYEALGQSLMNNLTDHFNLLGQVVDIDIQQGNDSANAYKFRGVIQDVAVERQGGEHEYLVIKGASLTILMENVKRYDAFPNSTLKQVVSQLTENIINQKSYFPIVNNPAYTEQIKFLMQYNESDWQFLRRLCCIAKENMYWTGQELVFGMHKDFPTLEITYGRELVHSQFSGRYLPNHFPYYQRLPESESILKGDMPDKVESRDISVNVAEREKSNLAYDTICVSGTSKTAHPRIGHLLKINRPSITCATADMGTFRITKVTHEFDRNNHYECQFEGISADLKYYPFLDVKNPKTEPISVLVVDNVDPEEQGRVRVKFLFDSDSAKDAWMRVMIPYAKVTDDEKKNKPADFMPEAGDQVTVNFMFGDPNLPYVIANMFNRKNKKIGVENAATNIPVTVEDYKFILKFRKKVYRNLDIVEQLIEEFKKDSNNSRQITRFRILLEFLLLVAQTEKGKKIFLGLLEYVKDIDPDLSNEYWKTYDEQIETILKNGHYKIKKNN